MQLECCDAFSLLEKHRPPDLRCVAYRPTVPRDRAHGAKYQHDMTTTEEHERLAEICNRMPVTERR